MKIKITLLDLSSVVGHMLSLSKILVQSSALNSAETCDIA